MHGMNLTQLLTIYTYTAAGVFVWMMPFCVWVFGRNGGHQWLRIEWPTTVREWVMVIVAAWLSAGACAIIWPLCLPLIGASVLVACCELYDLWERS